MTTSYTAADVANLGSLQLQAIVNEPFLRESGSVVGDRVVFSVDDKHLDAVVRGLSSLGLRSLVAEPPSLEDLFLRHYADELAVLEGSR